MIVNKTALIDGDVLLHELGWSGEFKDKETGERILFDFEKVADLLDQKLMVICEEAGATQDPIIFFSDNEYIARRKKREFTPGFRYSIAKTRPYKGNRTNPKPFHFYNILAYLMATRRCRVSRDGLEADDVMAIFQNQMYEKDTTIICSRDKDLRITPGWHYSWECGSQAAIGPLYTDELGYFREKTNGDTLGFGLKFFYYQMLVGDSADYIPGLKGWGPAKALPIIDSCSSEEELIKTVKDLYKEAGMTKEYFLEQANLLWIIQELDEGGKPKGFKLK